VKGSCVKCEPCPHEKLKHHCADCNPCLHGKQKDRCTVCKAAHADPPTSKRIKREKESPPEIKQELEIKQEPEIKQAPEPFTVQSYFGFDDGR
tara:strand:+ start:3880 stop:4158 length:279 start_codon:yes stop_codon:yes gene_type:complete